MSTREELRYEQMVEEDQRKTAEMKAAAKEAGKPSPPAIITEPIDKVFFFPTESDAKIAQKWQERGIVTPNNFGTLRVALELVAKRVAVPLHYLRIVRSLEKE